VENLLANAHQHTPPGTQIAISGRATANEVRLVVSDTGPGIPAEELEAIFQRFHHLPAGDSGSGLGLAIARGLVELHGGRIWAESEAGQRTAFHVVVPRLQEGAV
jgi:signal transduction histidine kinase